MSDSHDLLKRSINAVTVRQVIEKFGRAAEVPSRDGVKFCSILRGDHHPSCTIEDNKYHDWTRGEHRDSYDLFQQLSGLDSKKAYLPFVQFAGLGHELTTDGNHQHNGKTAVTKPDWKRLVANVSIEQLAKLRGYTSEFCQWLRDSENIGWTGQYWAFPFLDNGKVVSTHIRYDKNEWKFSPTLKELGLSNAPFVIGDLKTAGRIIVGESQWDVFAALDTLGIHRGEPVAGVSTRGSGNGRMVSGIFNGSGAEVVVIPQNDQPKEDGKIPSEDWLKAIRANIEAPFKLVRAPKEYEDLNHWHQDCGDIAGAIESAPTKEPTDGEPPLSRNLKEEQRQREGAADGKPLRPMLSWIAYGNREVDRSHYHVGEGFLEIGGFVMLIGQSYVGKSTFITQLSICLAIGRPWLFFLIDRALRVMVVQAEDPENKLVKMGHMFKRMGLTDEEINLADQNTIVLTIRDVQDASAIREIERHALVFNPDVIVINPMTSFLGGSVYRDEMINAFLRVQLTPMLDRIKASAIVVHHPPKPLVSDKEEKDLTAFELQYGGAGMAALTNAPRGNMFLTHVDGDVFKLQVGKGFEDLGTKDTIAHLRRSKDQAGVMLWERCESEKAEEATEKRASRKAKKQAEIFIPYDRLLKCFKATDKYQPSRVIELSKKDLNRGKAWTKDALSQLVFEGKLAKTKEPNPKGQPFVFYHLPTILEPATNGESQ